MKVRVLAHGYWDIMRAPGDVFTIPDGSVVPAWLEEVPGATPEHSGPTSTAPSAITETAKWDETIVGGPQWHEKRLRETKLLKGFEHLGPGAKFVGPGQS